MSSILVGRTRARSQAIQLLFQAEIQGVDVFDLLAGGSYVLEDGPLDEYGEQIARGVARTRLSIDRLIAGVSQNWNLSRMPLVDRTIMSVAIHEMFDEPEVPTSVAISEAVEISKVYGTDDSSSFVNGVLGRVARMAEEHPDMSLGQIAKTVAPLEEPVAQAEEPAEGGEPAGETAADAQTASAESEGAAEPVEAPTAEVPAAEPETPVAPVAAAEAAPVAAEDAPAPAAQADEPAPAAESASAAASAPAAQDSPAVEKDARGDE